MKKIDKNIEKQNQLMPAPRLIPKLMDDEILRLANNGRLQSISLRLPCACNLNCSYCYSSGDRKQWITPGHPDALQFDQIVDLLDQAIDLGARYVWFVGDGEPLMYKESEGKDFYALIEHITKAGVRSLIFTNATIISKNIARRLFQQDTAIIAKQNTLDPDTQNRICGRDWTYDKLIQGMDNLIEAGFTDTEPSRLSVETIISRDNIDEIKKLWVHFRKKKIIPYFQVCVPPDDPREVEAFVKNTAVKPDELLNLFKVLKDIDESQFGFTWDVMSTYPIAALGCDVVRTSCGITPEGDLKLCAYTATPLGNIKNIRLEDILLSEQVIDIKSRYYNNASDLHYGCRALTYNLTGDRFATDPVWDEMNI